MTNNWKASNWLQSSSFKKCVHFYYVCISLISCELRISGLLLFQKLKDVPTRILGKSCLARISYISKSSVAVLFWLHFRIYLLPTLDQLDHQKLHQKSTALVMDVVYQKVQQLTKFHVCASRRKISFWWHFSGIDYAKNGHNKRVHL